MVFLFTGQIPVGTASTRQKMVCLVHLYWMYCFQQKMDWMYKNNLHSSIQVIRELVRYMVDNIHKMSDLVQLEVKIFL